MIVAADAPWWFLVVSRGRSRGLLCNHEWHVDWLWSSTFGGIIGPALREEAFVMRLLMGDLPNVPPWTRKEARYRYALSSREEAQWRERAARRAMPTLARLKVRRVLITPGHRVLAELSQVE